MSGSIRTALAMSAIPVPEELAMEALAELDALEKERDDLRLMLDALLPEKTTFHVMPVNDNRDGEG